MCPTGSWGTSAANTNAYLRVAYLGLAVAIAGLACVMKPFGWPRIPTRRRAAADATAGVVVIAIALALPVPESRFNRAESRLDEFAPVWQFREFHTIAIAAPPARVFEAIKRVRPDEILLFRTLIWIRTGGQRPPEDILDATRR